MMNGSTGLPGRLLGADVVVRPPATSTGTCVIPTGGLITVIGDCEIEGFRDCGG